jgi:hypothetical protein
MRQSGGRGGIKSREKPIESCKVAPASHTQLILTLSGSARFRREWFRFLLAQLLEDLLLSDSLLTSHLRPQAQCEPAQSLSHQEEMLLMGFTFLRWSLWGRCVHFFYCLWAKRTHFWKLTGVHDVIFENGEGEMSVYENSRPRVNITLDVFLILCAWVEVLLSRPTLFTIPIQLHIRIGIVFALLLSYDGHTQDKDKK